MEESEDREGVRAAAAGVVDAEPGFSGDMAFRPAEDLVDESDGEIRDAPSAVEDPSAGVVLIVPGVREEVFHVILNDTIC